MSDEEKEAIEFIKSELEDEKKARDDYQSLTGLYGNLEIEILLNLIEEQTKEIEELKNADLTTVYLNGFYDGEKKVKDKIKAKIEPKLKELDEQMKKEWKEYGNSREYQDMEDEWNFLQSLLEKE